MSRILRIAVPIDLDWPVKRHHEVYSGIQAYANEVGNWEIIPDQYPAAWIRSKGDQGGYDGMVGRISKKVADVCKDAGVPAVNVWHASPVRGKVPSVLADYERAGQITVEHLVARGIRRVAAILFRRDSGSKAFFEGVKAAAKQERIPLTHHYCSRGVNESEGRWHQFVEDVDSWINGWEQPIGVACSSDNQGRYVALMCQRKGINIPEQIVIMGAGNDSVLCEGSAPSLSSIDMAYYQVGYKAAAVLDRMLKSQTRGKGITEKTEPADEDRDTRAADEDGEVGADKGNGINGGVVELTSEEKAAADGFIKQMKAGKRITPIMVPPTNVIARRSTDAYLVDDDVVSKAMRYMAENSRNTINVNDIAAHVNVARRTIERRFRAAFGKPINEVLVNFRMEIVKRRLIESNVPIKKIAKEAGFGTTEHMRFAFKQQIGISPVAFRRQNRPASQIVPEEM